MILAHLSDIHFKVSGNAVNERRPKIASAILSIDPSAKHYFLVVSGDVAQSGAVAEYEVAYEFFSALRNDILAERPHAEVNIVVAPGNHDFNVTLATGAREILIGGVRADESKIQDVSIAEPILAPHENFFAFAERITGDKYPLAERILARRAFFVNSSLVVFYSYNTAWGSTVPENSGKTFPLPPSSTEVEHRLAVSVLHHPPSWFAPNEAHRLRGRLESNSDIILTGHEHEPSIYAKDLVSGEKPQYAEGGVLQEWGADRSAFNLIEFDLTNARQRRFVFEWKSGRYQSDQTRDWVSFSRGKQFHLGQFQPSASFHRLLNDVGTPFTHPAKASLTLDDIYVDLELAQFPTLRPQEKTGAVRASDSERLLAGGRVLIAGAEHYGKSTLAKVLCRRLQQQGEVPLLIDGTRLTRAVDTFLENFTLSAVAEQYGEAEARDFWQVPLAKRAIIIDDFDDSPMSARARDAVVTWLADRFGTIVVFVNDAYWIEQLTTETGVHGDLVEFAAWRLEELDAYLRSRLIERWFTLGGEISADEALLARRVAAAQKLIHTLRGRNIFPSTPLNVLTILQAHEMQRDLSVLGHGYMYEALISARLAAWPTTMPRDAVATLLASIAYDLFDSGRTVFSEAELGGYVRAYFDHFKIPLAIDGLKRELLRCLLLERFGDGYRFKYPYVYYYFVAKYFQRHLQYAEHVLALRSRVGEMTRALHVIENVNILIFLVYLTHDRTIIRELVQYARSIFATFEPSNLDADVAFLNVVSASSTRYQLPSTSPRENWHEEQKRLDFDGDGSSDDDTDAMTLNSAMKAVQILGQVLRSFAGSLEADLKVEIGRECYLLGLRMIAAMLSSVEKALPSLRSAYVQAHLEKRTDQSEAELGVEAERFAGWLSQILVQTLVRRVAYAVGYEHLTEIYRDVLRSFDPPTVAVELIDHAVHLDNCLAVDAEAVVRFYERVKKNLIPAAVLRELVYDYLRLFPTERRTRQLLADKFDFRANDPRFLLSS
jgi:hypothetical protein